MPEFDPDYDRRHGQPADFQQVESLVRAASRYLQPTDDLRPNALEAARRACRQQRTSRRLGGLAFLALLVAATGFPEVLFSSNRGLVALQSSELHRRAARSVVENGTEMNWALYEAYRDLRREHATRLRHAH